MRVVLLGPPGAGKGTQAQRVADALSVSRVSSGDLFREHRERGTELGRLAGSYMDRGALVPDEVTIDMVMDWIDDPDRRRGFVLDGFPRTLAQAKALDRRLGRQEPIDAVLYMDVSTEELTRRLTGRLLCRECQTPYHERFSPPSREGECDHCGGDLYRRTDDIPEAVARRIEVYKDQTEPLVAYYRVRGNLVEIHGEGSMKQVGNALMYALRQARAAPTRQL